MEQFRFKVWIKHYLRVMVRLIISGFVLWFTGICLVAGLQFNWVEDMINARYPTEVEASEFLIKQAYRHTIIREEWGIPLPSFEDIYFGKLWMTVVVFGTWIWYLAGIAIIELFYLWKDLRPPPSEDKRVTEIEIVE